MKYVILIFFAALIFAYGVWVGLYQVFPFEQLKYTKRLIMGDAYSESGFENRCSSHVIKHDFFSQIAEHGNSSNIFFGDSVVDGLWSENFFGLAYSKMASSGNIVQCLDLIGPGLLALRPKNIIIYLGGNDADGQGRQSVSELSVTYRNFVEQLRAIDANVVIHGIHRGFAERRDKNYVDELNDALRDIAVTTDSHFIGPFDLLDFVSDQDNFNELTYDGEHLKAKAYLQWLKYIDANLPESFPKFLDADNR